LYFEKCARHACLYGCLFVFQFLQVGGYRIDYQGLTFATVRNSGHMVPYVTPERAFHLLGEFLYGDRDGFDSSSSSSSSGRPQEPAATQEF
jgi:hypothetical protein